VATIPLIQLTNSRWRQCIHRYGWSVGSPAQPTWAKWTINDPNIGGAAGLVEEVSGS
jgi:hypothetical protein